MGHGLCKTSYSKRGNQELLRSTRRTTAGVILNAVQQNPTLSTDEVLTHVEAVAKVGKIVGATGQPWYHNTMLLTKVRNCRHHGFEGHRHRYYTDSVYAANMDGELIPADLFFNTYEGTAEEMVLVEPSDLSKEWLPFGRVAPGNKASCHRPQGQGAGTLGKGGGKASSRRRSACQG